MGQIDNSISSEHERQRLERIGAVLDEAFEGHPETRAADRCAIKSGNQRGIVIDDYDDLGELSTARLLAAHSAFTSSTRTPTNSGRSASGPDQGPA